MDVNFATTTDDEVQVVVVVVADEQPEIVSITTWAAGSDRVSECQSAAECGGTMKRPPAATIWSEPPSFLIIIHSLPALHCLTATTRSSCRLLALLLQVLLYALLVATD